MSKKNTTNKIISLLMLNGHKWSAETILLKTFKKLQKLKTKKSFEGLIKLSLVNTTPSFYIKTLKRRKKIYKEFPFLLPSQLKQDYGIKNIIHNSKVKNQLSFYINLTNEIYKSVKMESKSFIKTQEQHKTAFAQKKFANYRWF